jgi:exodeoxyribonuclease VII large subunit
MAQARERLQAFTTRMDRSLSRTLQRAVVRRGAVDARLHSLSPLAVLDRGYALVIGEDGSLIRSAAQLTEGERVTTRVAEGAFISRVEATGAPKEKEKGRKG